MLCGSSVGSNETSSVAKTTATGARFQTVTLLMHRDASDDHRVHTGSHGHPRSPHICLRQTRYLDQNGVATALFALERARMNWMKRLCSTANASFDVPMNVGRRQLTENHQVAVSALRHLQCEGTNELRLIIEGKHILKQELNLVGPVTIMAPVSDASDYVEPRVSDVLAMDMAVGDRKRQPPGLKPEELRFDFQKNYRPPRSTSLGETSSFGWKVVRVVQARDLCKS